jgi:hypothetical protein
MLHEAQGVMLKAGLLKGLQTLIHELVLHVAVQEISLSVYGDGWFNLCRLITQCTTGVQPNPAPGSNQTPPGEAAETSRHPHSLHSGGFVKTFKLPQTALFNRLPCQGCLGLV